MTSKLIHPHSSLAGGSRWTTVSLLNGALAGAALSAIQNWKALSDPGGKASATPQTQPASDLETVLAEDTGAEDPDLFLPICPW